MAVTAANPAEIEVARVRRRSACENGAVIVQSFPRGLGGVVASDFSDPTNERLIYLSAAGLALVGLALLVGTIVWWRRARQEHPALAPLEVMSGRAWAKAPEGDRRRRLEQVRVAGSAAAADGSTLAEPVDLQALVRSVPQAFDDLREPGDAIALPSAEEPVEPANPDDVAEADKVEGGVDPARVDPAKADGVDEPPRPADADATSVSIERPAEAIESST